MMSSQLDFFLFFGVFALICFSPLFFYWLLRKNGVEPFPEFVNWTKYRYSHNHVADDIIHVWTTGESVLIRILGILIPLAAFGCLVLAWNLPQGDWRKPIHGCFPLL